MTVLPLDVGALTSTPRWVSSFSMASIWNGSSGQGRVAWNSSRKLRILVSMVLMLARLSLRASGATRHEGCVADPVGWIRPFVQGFVQSPDDRSCTSNMRRTMAAQQSTSHVVLRLASIFHDGRIGAGREATAG